jgi:hypothetical protein
MFAILQTRCCSTQFCSKPSFASFHAFTSFMGAMFEQMKSNSFLFSQPQLHSLKHYAIKILLETSKEYTLRMVPQLDKVGFEAEEPGRESNINDGAGAAALKPPRLTRHVSSNAVRHNGLGGKSASGRRLKRDIGGSQKHIDELVRVNELNGPPALIRQLSDDVAGRFALMATWNSRDHPVMFFKKPGFQVISLDKAFLRGQIDDVQTISGCAINNLVDIDRDWTTLTTIEAVGIIRRVAGKPDAGDNDAHSSLDAGYVITTDNMLKMMCIQLRLQCNLPGSLTMI